MSSVEEMIEFFNRLSAKNEPIPIGGTVANDEVGEYNLVDVKATKTTSKNLIWDQIDEAQARGRLDRIIPQQAKRLTQCWAPAKCTSETNVKIRILELRMSLSNSFVESQFEGFYARPADVLRAVYMGYLSETRLLNNRSIEETLQEIDSVRSRNLPRDAEYALCLKIDTFCEEHKELYPDRLYDEKTLKAYREQMAWLESRAETAESGEKYRMQIDPIMRPEVKR